MECSRVVLLVQQPPPGVMRWRGRVLLTVTPLSAVAAVGEVWSGGPADGIQQHSTTRSSVWGCLPWGRLRN